MRRYFVKLPPNYDHATKLQGCHRRIVLRARAATNPMPIDYTGVTDGDRRRHSDLADCRAGRHAGRRRPLLRRQGSELDRVPLRRKMIAEVGEKFCYRQEQGVRAGPQQRRLVREHGRMCHGQHVHPRDLLQRRRDSRRRRRTAQSARKIPTPGLWIHPTGDTEQPNATRRSLGRALRVNKCEGAGPVGDTTAWNTAPSDPYTMGGGVACRKYRCPAAFPVIFCTAAGRPRSGQLAPLGGLDILQLAALIPQRGK